MFIICKNVLYYVQRVHEYGETCELYPCEECGFQGTDLSSLQKHNNEMHKKLHYNKRIKQNLHNIDLDDDSDDEWAPNIDDEKLLIEETDETDILIPNKRKRTNLVTEPNKKSKSEFVCTICLKTFSSKDSLNRHVQNICSKK